MKHGTVEEAVQAAEAVLPGAPAPDGEVDFRWKAIIEVGRFVESHPEEVLDFVHKWGGHEDEDLRSAIATCVLEHLLEHHFDRVALDLAQPIAKDPHFRSMCQLCWSFGDAQAPERRLRWRTMLAPGPDD